MRLIGRNARYSALVPSVDLVVSTRSVQPHALKEWYAETDVKVPEYSLPCRLVGQQLPSWVHDMAACKMIPIVDGRVPDGEDACGPAVVPVTEVHKEANNSNSHVLCRTSKFHSNESTTSSSSTHPSVVSNIIT